MRTTIESLLLDATHRCKTIGHEIWNYIPTLNERATPISMAICILHQSTDLNNITIVLQISGLIIRGLTVFTSVKVIINPGKHR